MIIIRHHSYC